MKINYALTEGEVEWSLRLANGIDERQGRVEIFHDGQWGTVCDDNFREEDAQVVCRQLGFGDAVATVAEYRQFDDGVGPIWLDEVACGGAENQMFLIS